ncbi:MAG TPA: TIGR03435 family protein [Vicinamibacterales bacterium]|nr:TIGR03435 family protein [Vicinamibacterales bacterium]
MRASARFPVCALLLVLYAIGARAQTTGLTEASFEAASIKRNVSGAAGSAFNARPTGQFTVTNMAIADIVAAAYQLQPFQLANAPDWMRHERYDIVAKLDAKIAAALQPDGLPPTWALALRSLLRDQLKLSFHRESEERPVYALMRARPDGRLGPNLRPAANDCDTLKEQAVAAARIGGANPYPPTTDTSIACGLRVGNGRIVAGGFGLTEFRMRLSPLVGRPVVDGGGLDGQWDLLLTFTPDSQVHAGEPLPADAPDLFTALREQLGLKLEATKAPVNLLVIDRIERPESN